MEFISGNQITPSKIEEIKFDLILGASAKEDRSTHLFEKYSIEGTKKIVLQYQKNGFELKKRLNTDLFNIQGFETLIINPDNSSHLVDFVESYLKTIRQSNINILIDYSCMTKESYAGIISLINRFEESKSLINIYFSYSTAKFEKTKIVKSVRHCSTLMPGHGHSDSQKPTCLIVGLGLHENYSEFIKNEIKPDSIVLFYSDPAPEGYIETIFKNNQELIDGVDIRDLYNYPLDDLNKTSEKLTNICINLRLKYNIVIAPLGPKVFTLLSLILAVRYPDIDVWNINSGKNVFYKKSVANQEPLLFHAKYENIIE